MSESGGDDDPRAVERVRRHSADLSMIREALGSNAMLAHICKPSSEAQAVLDAAEEWFYELAGSPRTPELRALRDAVSAYIVRRARAGGGGA
jgi:hypothetical protein